MLTDEQQIVGKPPRRLAVSFFAATANGRRRGLAQVDMA
jgi:hypothetical protein